MILALFLKLLLGGKTTLRPTATKKLVIHSLGSSVGGGKLDPDEVITGHVENLGTTLDNCRSTTFYLY